MSKQDKKTKKTSNECKKIENINVISKSMICDEHKHQTFNKNIKKEKLNKKNKSPGKGHYTFSKFTENIIEYKKRILTIISYTNSKRTKKGISPYDIKIINYYASKDPNDKTLVCIETPLNSFVPYVGMKYDNNASSINIIADTEYLKSNNYLGDSYKYIYYDKHKGYLTDETITKLIIQRYPEFIKFDDITHVLFEKISDIVWNKSLNSHNNISSIKLLYFNETWITIQD